MANTRRAALALPILQWLPDYQRAWLRPDLVAGLTLAAYLLPAGIGDASLAGLPPEAGLYACLFSGLVFWLFCSSKHTVITVTSALSLLIAASVGELSGGDPARHAALAACLDHHGGGHRVRRVAGARRQCRSASSPRPCWSASRRGWRSTSRARSCPSSSASRARTATSGNARRISSGTSATRTRRRCSSAPSPRRAHRRQALAEEPAGGLPRRGRRHRWRRDSSTSRRTACRCWARCRRACPSLGLPDVEPARAERPPARGAGELRARRRRDLRDRPHVRPEARQSVRRQSGAAGARRRQSRSPGSAAGFPVSGGMSQSLVNESAGRAHAALGPGRRAASRSSSCSSRPACCATCRSPCWPRSCSRP